MFYEVYIDIFFVVNAILDFWILMIAKHLQHYRSTKIRLLGASLTGSGILSLFLCIPVRRCLFVRILFYIGAYAGMAAVAFPGNSKKGMIKAAVTLYGVSLLVNGIFRWMNWRIEHVLSLSVCCVFAYAIVRGLYMAYVQLKVSEEHIYEVRIIYQGQIIHLKGLWDTGNRLRSPYHGRGVSVIGYENIYNYVSDAVRAGIELNDSGDSDEKTGEEHLFYIPYETVNQKHGIMPVLMAEKMLIEKEEEELEYRNPLLGISKMPVSNQNAFQIVLTADG